MCDRLHEIHPDEEVRHGLSGKLSRLRRRDANFDRLSYRNRVVPGHSAHLFNEINFAMNIEAVDRHNTVNNLALEPRPKFESIQPLQHLLVTDLDAE